jgi:hypothetical protein
LSQLDSIRSSLISRPFSLLLSMLVLYSYTIVIMKNRRGGNVMDYICWLGIDCDEVKEDVNKQVESNSLDPAMMM